MIDTPKTDAASFMLSDIRHNNGQTRMVHVDFAREQERTIAELVKELEWWRVECGILVQRGVVSAAAVKRIDAAIQRAKP